MGNREKLNGVYYPDRTVENGSSLATFCLYFDEVYTIGFDSFSEPTLAFPKVEQLKISLSHPLRVTFKSFSLGPTQAEKAIDSFIDSLPDEMLEKLEQLRDGSDILERFLAIYMLVEKEGWIPIGDDPEIPFIVKPARVSSSARELSTILAEECLRLVIPRCLPADSEDILEAREKLKDELIPFRMSMQRLAYTLRKEFIPKPPLIEDLRREARFLAETNIEPLLHDLQRKIELEKGKFWRRVFGRVLGWVPLIGQAIVSPTPDLLSKAFEKASKDTEDLLLSAQGISAAAEPALSFLLKVKDFMEKKQAL